MLGRLRKLLCSDAFQRRAWLAVIIAVLGAYKVIRSYYLDVTGTDGGYYLDVASHIRDGRGILSNCSILYAAYPEFPFPAAVYPLWPLLIGLVAKAFPMFETGKWLATACYFGTLGFAYLWGRALYPRRLVAGLPGFNAGHVLALMFGLHDYFFIYTSQPYTEGLTFALTCAALWRMTRLLPRPTWWGGLEVGAWLGLIILARYQMVLLAMAVFPVLAAASVLSSGPRRDYAIMTACAAVALLLVVGPHYLFVASFTPNLTPASYVQWQRVRFRDVLSPIPDVLQVKGTWPWIVDRWRGVRIAFGSEFGANSYGVRFHTFHYALVPAIPLVLLLGVLNASRTKVRLAWRWLRRPRNLNWIFVVCFAGGSLLMIHSMHMDRKLYPEWYFGQRHALVCMFAFFLSLLLLLAQKRFPWKLIGIVILCGGVYMGLPKVRKHALAVEGKRPSGADAALVEWLNHEAEARDDLIVAYRQPQLLAYRTPRVGYHWYYRHTVLKDIRAMVDKLGAAYVIVPPKPVFPFQRGDGFLDSFELVKTIAGTRIYKPRASVGGPAAAPDSFEPPESADSPDSSADDPREE
ncbi:MAG: hypothetical protein WKG00_13520 [Polyangiaceae bacterium]